MITSTVSTDPVSVLLLPLTGRAKALTKLGKEDVRYFLRGEWDELHCTVLGTTHRMPRHEVTLEFFIDSRLLDTTMVCV